MTAHQQRYLHLAASMLRGRTYRQCEPNAHRHPTPAHLALAMAVLPQFADAAHWALTRIAGLWIAGGTLAEAMTQAAETPRGAWAVAGIKTKCAALGGAV